MLNNIFAGLRLSTVCRPTLLPCTKVGRLRAFRRYHLIEISIDYFRCNKNSYNLWSVPCGSNRENRPGGVLTREQFLLVEMRIVAALRLEGVSDGDIVERVKQENLFQYPTERMLGNRAQVCLRRLDAVKLDDAECAARGVDSAVAEQAAVKIVELIAHGTPDQAAQSNLYAMICRYDLVREFMLVEIGERMAGFDYAYTDVDLNAFMTRFQVEHADAREWSDATVYRIKGTLRQILRNSGLMPTRQLKTLTPLFVDPDVEDAITALGDATVLTAFNGQVM